VGALTQVAFQEQLGITRARRRLEATNPKPGHQRAGQEGRSKPVKVLLINPAFGPRVSLSRYNRPWPPLDLLNCAALLEGEGHSVSLLDLRARPRPPALVAVEGQKADLILLTTSPLDRWQCPNLELAPVRAAAKALPRERTFLGGVQGTLFPQEILELTGVRGVIRGEPEETLLDLASGRPLASIPGLTWWGEDREVRANPHRPALDPAGLPFPAYHLLDLDDYSYPPLGRRMAVLETARGCPHRCPFCLKVMYPPPFRAKTAAQVLAEVERLVADHRPGCLYFIDLEFLARPGLARAVCRGLIERGYHLPWACQTRLDSLDPDLLGLLARAGCRLIHLGLETADPTAREEARKTFRPAKAGKVLREARRLGIRTAGFFLLGLPGQGAAQARETAALARRLAPSFASFHAHTPYPQTPWGTKSGSWSAFQREALRREELYSGTVRRAYLSFYLRPGQLLEILRSGARVWEGLRLWRGLMG